MPISFWMIKQGSYSRRELLEGLLSINCQPFRVEYLCVKECSVNCTCLMPDGSFPIGNPTGPVDTNSVPPSFW